MNFDDAFERLIGHEGGYVNHPDDPGGETMYGITARVARASGYTGQMKSLPLDVAKQIARSQYWDPVGAPLFHPAVAFELFDMAYNHGVSRSIKIFQQAVGTKADGIIGKLTIAAAGKFSNLQLICLINSFRLEFYTGLGTWPTFGKGWARRVSSNLRAGAGSA